MQVKRTNRENGQEDFVSMDHAVDKLASANFETVTKDDKNRIKEALELGATMNTVSYLYELDRKELA